MKGVDHVAALAVEALLAEVTATLKPGLVDRANNGAHDDMDFFTELLRFCTPWLWGLSIISLFFAIVLGIVTI